MKKKPDPVLFRQSLLQLLEANPAREEQLLGQLERQSDGSFYSALLSILTHLSFTEAEARRHFERIRSHRFALKTRLGRDVGLRVAILDYFVNVVQALRNPKVIELSIYERTERSAVTDGLTGLYNHAYFLGALRRELQRAKRHTLSVTLSMFDLDNFKKLNDTRGHLEGDRVLIRVGALMREELREVDLAARYGGEEFAVVLPDTPRAGGHVVAERIRRRIEERFRRARRRVPVTVSGGVAAFPEDAATAEELVQRADQALYHSKADGKNRITLAGGERRRHLRIPMSARVTLSSAAAGRLVARARNLSEDGLLLSARAPVPVGSRLDLTIRQQGSPALLTHGEVVRLTAGDDARFDVGVKLSGDSARQLFVLGRPARA
jgi:diguanylate cyclase (GGDEF)-like protein